MNITGIIAEYNIFHNGHKYQIDEAKKQCDAVIAVMSGSFVQRGDVAITDKWSRTKAALMCGVDLVVELPTCYTLNAAYNFASGGIGTLHALGVVDSVCFGSESGCIEKLKNAAVILENESEEISLKIKKYTSKGLGYPAAVTKAYNNDLHQNLLTEPNNILAIEYIRAIIRLKSDIKPVTVQRYKAGHHDSKITSNITSASKLREMISSGQNIEKLLPYDIKTLNCDIPYSISALDTAIISKLRLSTASYLQNISEVTEGLENRIIQAANETYSFNELVDKIKNKRFTTSKIRRILISALIGNTKDIYTPMPQYIRVLGLNKTGMNILKEAKKVCTVPIITKVADYKDNNPQFKLDLNATDISMLCNPNPKNRLGRLDFKTSPIIIK